MPTPPPSRKEQIDAAERQERELRDGFRAYDYTGDKCEKCGRQRVMNCVNGRRVCEKCGWDQDKHEQSEYDLG